MNAFSRRGACPALSAPMRTGDGLLVRLNPLASGFSPNTLIGLCESASRHGNGLVEVTARGSLQIRGLNETTAPLLAAEVDALGIEVRTGVPVETGPLAGLDPDETADPRPLAEAIRRGIAASGLSPRLGPKVSVVVDGGGRFGMENVAADVRLEAVGSGRWMIAVAGTADTALPIGTFDANAACKATLAVLTAVARLGREARARDLRVDDLRGNCSTLPTSGLPAISPTGEEISQSPTLELPISPPVGEMAGRPEWDNVEHRSCKTAQPGFHTLRDSRVALAVALPFGQMRAESVIAFARAAEGRSARDIRIAPGRLLLVPCPDRPAAEALRTMANDIGFVTDPADPRLSIAACPGAPACGSGKIPARDLAATIARDHAALFDGSFELHVSGCAKGCAHPAPAALTLVGADRGCGLVLGGTARAAPVAHATDPASGFARLAALWNASARDAKALAAAFSGNEP